MNRNRLAPAVVLLIAALPALAPSGKARAQEPKAAAAATLLKVGGEVPKPLQLTADALARLPRRTVSLKDNDGKEKAYEGVLVVDLLRAAGIELGSDLRGEALTYYLVVEASDGYRVVFSLPQVDSTKTERIVLLADRLNGKPLDAKEGPLRIVIPADRRGFLWVRQVIALKMGHVP